jgi:MFS family permease
MESSASTGPVASAVLDRRRWWALALLCGTFFMVLLDGTIMIVALPSIGARLRFSEQGLPWVLSAYALTFGGLLLLGGRAADLLGRRRVSMAGAVFFTTAALLCGLAGSPTALLAARVVQGAGAAIMTPTALSIISTTFTEGSERNKALGIWGALGGIGAATAWLIGGPLVDGPGWRWIFFINVAIGLAALALSPVLLRESRAAPTAIVANQQRPVPRGCPGRASAPCPCRRRRRGTLPSPALSTTWQRTKARTRSPR